MKICCKDMRYHLDRGDIAILAGYVCVIREWMDIVLNDIRYCPYCGAKIEVEGE